MDGKKKKRKKEKENIKGRRQGKLDLVEEKDNTNIGSVPYL